MSQQAGMWRVTQTETLGEIFVDPSLFKYLSRRSSLFGRQHFPEPGAGPLVNLQQFLPFIRFRVAAASVRRNRHTALFRNNPDRLRKSDSLSQHHKIENVPSGP